MPLQTRIYLIKQHFDAFPNKPAITKCDKHFTPIPLSILNFTTLIICKEIAHFISGKPIFQAPFLKNHDAKGTKFYLY